MKILAKQLFLTLAVVGALCACSDDDDDGGSPPVATAKKDTQQTGGGAGDTPTKSVVPPSAGAGEQSVAEVESQLRDIPPMETYGGQLLATYLNSPTEDVKAQVVAQVFDDDEYVLSNLAEMSLGVKQLRRENKYPANVQEDVQVLEGAMTQYLNEKIEYHKKLEDYIEYGTAIGLGVIGGVYSDKVIAGLRRLGNSRFVQAPKRGIVYLTEKTSNGAKKVGGWFTAQGSKIRNSDPVAKTVEKSGSLYRKAAAYAATGGGAVTSKTFVQRHMVRLFGGEDLAKGFRIVDIPEAELGGVKRMVFQKTKINGFRIHQRKGEDYFVARQVRPDGEFDYFYVRGLGVKTLTRGGEEMVITPKTMAALTASRLQSFGNRTVQFMTDTGRRIKTGVTNSRAYKFVTTNEGFRRGLEKTAVGGTIGGLTLLALRPIDTRYLTLEDYVADLEAEGVNIDEFLDTERNEAQSTARVGQSADVR